MIKPLRNATLRQLHIFLVAAEQQSFARAAELLNLTQPAVSMQMSQLADSVGMALFEKNGRNLALTRAGKALVPYVQRIKQTLREASEEMDALQGLKRGKVRIAMVTTARYFAPKLIAQFQAQHKEIQLDITVANRRQVIEKLENNKVDLAIMGRPPSRIAVETEWFAEHPYVVIAAPEHPLAGKKRIAPQKLKDEVFLAREQGSGTRIVLDHYFSDSGLEAPALRELTSNETIKQEVMAGMGLAVISMHTISLECRTGNLAILDVRNMPVKRAWYVLHLTNKPLSPAARAFKTFMQAEAPGYMKNFFGETAKKG
jgi:LysR family transcriptional regulator, low CO2-responsive transcriptional regulator